jgi:hypothetical protein
MIGAGGLNGSNVLVCHRKLLGVSRVFGLFTQIDGTLAQEWVSV